MKTKVLLTALSAIMMVGCTNDEPVASDSANVKSSVSISNKRSIDEVVKMAEHFAGLLDSGKRSTRKIASGHNAVQVLGLNFGRSNNTNDTVLYVVNYDNSQGFAIIAAPQNVPPLIGIVESGEFANLETASNANFQYYLAAATSYVANNGFSNSGDIVIKPIYDEWHKIVNDRIEPKLKVEWGQRFPEGYFCPNKISGCVQTATAQIMSYFEMPTSIELTYPGRDKEVEKLYWPQTKQHVQSSNISNQTEFDAHFAQCNASTYVHYALGRLCREIGHRNNANYRESSTGVTISTLSNETSVIQRYNLKSYFPNKNVSGFKLLKDYDVLYQGLKEGIAMLNGVDYSVGGHAWVVDGGLQTGTITYRTSTVDVDIITGKPMVTVIKNLQTVFHFNWGWNGNCNGYFDAGVFNTDKMSDHPAVPKNESRGIAPYSKGYDFDDYVEYCIIK